MTLGTIAVALGAGACGGGGSGRPATPPASTDPLSRSFADGGFPTPQPPVKGGRLRLATDGDADTWNGLSYLGVSASLFAFLARGLYGYPNTVAEPDTATVRPELAAALPDVSEDGLDYVIRLRPGLRFPDGSPVTANDVRATFAYLLDPNLAPATGGPVSSGYYSVIDGADAYTKAMRDTHGAATASIAGITAVNDLEVRFHLTRPDGAFLRALAMPWAFIRPATTPHTISPTPPPFVGPYRIVSYAPDNRVRIDREPSWGKNVAAGVPEAPDENNVDGVDIEVSVPADIQLLRLRNNDLDASFDGSAPAGSDLPAVARDAALADRFFSAPAAAVTYGFFRVDKPPFDNVDLRKAVNLAIDRRRLARLLGGDLRATPWAQILPANLLGVEPADLYPLEPDVRAAIALVAGAGVPTPIPITLAYSSDGASPDMAASVKESLDFVGFDVQLKGLASAVFSAYLDDPSSPYNLAWFRWEQDYPDAITFFGPLLTCPGGVPAGANYGGFCDQALDARVAETNRLAPGAERNTAFARLSTDTMRTSAPGWPIASERSANLVSSRVGNYLWGPTKLIYLSRVFLRSN